MCLAYLAARLTSGAAVGVPPDGPRQPVPLRNLFTCGGATNNESVYVQLNKTSCSPGRHITKKGDVVDTCDRFGVVLQNISFFLVATHL